MFAMGCSSWVAMVQDGVLLVLLVRVLGRLQNRTRIS